MLPSKFRLPQGEFSHFPIILNAGMVIDSRASNVVAYDYKKLQRTQSWQPSCQCESGNAGNDTRSFPMEVLDHHHLEEEAETLESFYASVKIRAANIDDLKAKQKIIAYLYDKFFKNAFPKMTERFRQHGCATC